MPRTLLTWPAAFALASAVLLIAHALSWSDPTTGVALLAAFLSFCAVAVPMTEGLGSRKR
jgi:hypothetical protein